MNNKADKNSEYYLTKDFNELAQEGDYVVRNKSLNQPEVGDYPSYHWNVSVRHGNSKNTDGGSDVFYQLARTLHKPNSIFLRHCINKVFSAWTEK